jgi:hypothetical protein
MLQLVPRHGSMADDKRALFNVDNKILYMPDTSGTEHGTYQPMDHFYQMVLN